MSDTSKTQIVRPLEWEDFEGRGSKAQAWRRANYIINRWSNGRFEVCESYPGYQGDRIGEGFYPDLEAAKAAAQADYEQRILAALNPDFLTRAETAEARLAEAVAFITWIEKTMVKNITENGLERPRLKLDGEYHTGPVVDWAHKVLIGMRDLSTATLTKIKGETDDE